MNDTECPCCSGLSLADCCQPYLDLSVAAPSALQLIRSRYSAYHLQLAEYLFQTWYPVSRHAELLSGSQQTLADCQWLGLTIIDQQTCSQNEATVTFFARYQSEQTRGYIYECSRFLKQQSRWYYVQGRYLQPESNAHCPCALGQKFKHCCAA